MTDITETVLVSLLVPALRKSLEKLQCKVEDTFIAALKKDPVYAMEWRANDGFELAAEISIKREMLYRYANKLERHEGDEPLRTTREQMRLIIMDIIKYKRAVANSTSPCSNLMEQHIIQMGMIMMDNTWRLEEFRDAQRDDADVQAELDREYTARKAEDEMYAQALADNKAFDRRARRASRKQA